MGSTVSTLTPHFEWDPLEGAATYSLILIQKNGLLVELKSNIESASYQTPTILLDGFEYSWWVRAIDENRRAFGISRELYSFKVDQP